MQVYQILVIFRFPAEAVFLKTSRIGQLYYVRIPLIMVHEKEGMTMGILKAAAGSLGGVLADQWKEFYLCESLSSETLVKKVLKQQTDRGANTEGDPNVVSDGSCIVVNEGQCGLVVDGGKVVAEFPLPGENEFHSDHSPSIFGGAGLKGIAKDMGRRFSFGGEAPIWQAVYYVNTKELPGPQISVSPAIPFRFWDPNTGLDLDGGVVCELFCTYRIGNPGLFFTRVSGSVAERYPRSKLDRLLESEMRSALQSALPMAAGQGIRPSQMGEHIPELCETVTRVLTEKWAALRGIEVVSLSISGLRGAEGDRKLIRGLQLDAALKDPRMAGAVMTGAIAEAVKTAAANPGGAVTGFVGMELAGRTRWLCRCGRTCTGNFCTACGEPRPTEWTCRCGARNRGNFCSNCGSPRNGSENGKN